MDIYLHTLNNNMNKSLADVYEAAFSNRFRGPSKASEGAKYIDLAVKLRSAIKGNRANKAKNLAELDHAIWKWYDNEYGED